MTDEGSRRDRAQRPPPPGAPSPLGVEGFRYSAFFVVFLAAVVFFAVVFLAVVVFFAVVFLVPAVFFAVEIGRASCRERVSFFF